MARAVSAIFGLVCLGAAAIAVYTATGDRELPIQPGVFADEPVLDFGELAQGDVRDAQFRLVNRHPEPIEVLGVATGCSCMESALSDRQIPPGGRFTLDIKWSVGIRRGRLADAVHVYYRTASGGRHMADLRLAANVIPDIHYAPDVLSFDADRPGTAVVRFTPGRRDPFALASASVSQAAFRAELDAARAEVTVTFDPEGWIDIGSDPWLTVETDSERQRRIDIPLRVARPSREVIPMPQTMPGGDS
jgi:hypothetical protein